MEYNILKIDSNDTRTFFYIAVNLTLAIGFFFQALQLIHFRNLSNVLLIIFGGLAPAVLALRVKYWMVYSCRQHQQSLLPEGAIGKGSFLQDLFVFVLVLVGFALILATFTQIYIESKEQKDNLMAVCFCLISGVCMGLGLAEIRILCRFKELRSSQGKQNYFFLKPLFWTLLISQMIVPAFMYPSLASQGQQSHNYSGKKMLFFVISALLVTIMLCGIGAALQHSELNDASLNLCMSGIPTLAMLLIDFLVINKAGKRIEASHFKESLMVYIGFGLLVAPQFLSNFSNVITSNRKQKQGWI